MIGLVSIKDVGLSEQKTYTKNELVQEYNQCVIDYNHALDIIDKNIKEREDLLVAMDNMEKISKREKRDAMIKGVAIGAIVVGVAAMCVGIPIGLTFRGK